ncbi:Glycerol 2-dehydrogenase (NADP(+)) [Grifola frondosa]|uniref:Glycerol 2-dehydrogenase (NADP(+)) n=1 Tax=Grifola frondosa TaxID=5627 RepID=A0A1C7MJM3_GRIFR|nr:Glycerol 2-dehydrogenase (NADP(+)) [Grifola frondosa]
MPAVGLGGWGGITTEDRENSTTWMLTALKSGYRLIDTAWIYGTEKATGRAIRLSGIPREDIWITTKLHMSHGGQVEKYFQEISTTWDTITSIWFVDLLVSANSGLIFTFRQYLMHWPQAALYDKDVPEPLDAEGQTIVVDSPTFNETWAEMEKIYESGRAKAIGVSNFSVKNLEKLLTTAKIVPAINQVEMHPYLIQQDLKDFCDKKGIVITAYTPTGYKNVVLAWHLARGVSVVPKSSNLQHQKDNLDLPTLDPEDVKRILHSTATNACATRRMRRGRCLAGRRIFTSSRAELGTIHMISFYGVEYHSRGVWTYVSAVSDESSLDSRRCGAADALILRLDGIDLAQGNKFVARLTWTSGADDIAVVHVSLVSLLHVKPHMLPSLLSNSLTASSFTSSHIQFPPPSALMSDDREAKKLEKLMANEAKADKKNLDHAIKGFQKAEKALINVSRLETEARQSLETQTEHQVHLAKEVQQLQTDLESFQRTKDANTKERDMRLAAAQVQFAQAQPAAPVV